MLPTTGNIYIIHSIHHENNKYNNTEFYDMIGTITTSNKDLNTTLLMSLWCTSFLTSFLHATKQARTLLALKGPLRQARSRLAIGSRTIKFYPCVTTSPEAEARKNIDSQVRMVRPLPDIL